MASETSIHRGVEVFLYTGQETNLIPRDVKRVRVDRSVILIPDKAFMDCTKLEEVDLCEGLQEIGDSAFHDCLALKHFTIPSTVKRIGEHAFYNTSLISLHLPDGVESVGGLAFLQCKFPNFRIPPLVTTISQGIFYRCQCLFSLELPESTRQIKDDAFSRCRSLRNAAIPPNAGTGRGLFAHCADLQQLFGSEAQIAVPPNALLEDVFEDCSDLQQLFGSEGEIIDALRHRFDGLPIHKILYYQSYHPVTLDQLNKATNMRSGQSRTLRSKLDPTGKEQDCLGMTPLHILACSTIQDLPLYQAMIEKYPENLITKDKWGGLPILYAIWSNAPSEIIQFLLNSHESIYPNQELNWSNMVETLGRANAPLNGIQNLLDTQQEHFPRQNIDWESALEKLADANLWEPGPSEETFRFLVKCSIAKRLNAIGLKLWRDDITNEMKKNNEMKNMPGPIGKRIYLADIRSKLAYYEAEYQKLKEAASTLELALWKAKIDESLSFDHSQGKKRRNKKMNMDGSRLRNQCRNSCGADIVFARVLPFLLPARET